MSGAPENIHPIFDRLIGRQEKEIFLKQRSCALWLTGLSGSGKSTIAHLLERKLFEKGFFVQVLDGDNVRTGINNNLGFSDTDRIENIRRIAEVTKLFVQSGIICINCFVSPTREIRTLAKNIIGENDFIEAYVNVPLEVAEQRDVKGLYKKARAGQIADFTGITSAFEEPAAADITLHTHTETVDQSVGRLVDYLLERITYK